MSEVQAQRTLVKSPPELWAEVSDAASLASHLGEFGEVRITRIEPERSVAWEGEHARGTVTIAPSGWGTQVSMVARTTAPEPDPPPSPPPAPPERLEHTVRVIGEEVVRIEPPAPEPPPAAPPPAPTRRPGLLARLFPRGRALEPPPAPTPQPAPAPPPVPYELRVTHAVVACRIPNRPAPPAPPAAAESGFDDGRVASVLAEVLDHLGAAHHRPFSRS